jgi:hypothetical protein
MTMLPGHSRHSVNCAGECFRVEGLHQAAESASIFSQTWHGEQDADGGDRALEWSWNGTGSRERLMFAR